MQFDDIDLKILDILQQQGKTSNIALSKSVGLSPGPTLERVKKLEKSGVIKGYHANLDRHLLGLGFTALVQLSLASQQEKEIANFKQQIHAIKEITECYQLAGNFDYQLKVMVKDIPAFEALIREKLSKIEVIKQMQTSVILSKVKDAKGVPL